VFAEPAEGRRTRRGDKDGRVIWGVAGGQPGGGRVRY